jgi:hypothetical protein
MEAGILFCAQRMPTCLPTTKRGSRVGPRTGHVARGHVALCRTELRVHQPRNRIWIIVVGMEHGLCACAREISEYLEISPSHKNKRTHSIIKQASAMHKQDPTGHLSVQLSRLWKVCNSP